MRWIIHLLVFAFGLCGAPADEVLIPVGVAQADVTPGYPVRLSGFGGRRTESEGVTARIWVKALAFADEQNGPAVLISTENLAVPDEITAEIARRLGEAIGLKRERLTITATHTHTAPMLRNVCPTLFGVPIPPEHQKNIDRYTVDFMDALERVAREAFRDIKPARLSWGMGTAGFAVNRRTKDGPVDHDLPLLVVRDGEGKFRAIYFSYACHCVTLSHNRISGDWAGFAQEKIQELFPGAVAMASVGCGADSNPSSGVTGGDVEACARQGDEIAREVKRVVERGLQSIQSRPRLSYARVDLPLAKARSRAEWEARAKQTDAAGHHARVNLAKLDRGETLPEKINYPVQTWIFGEDLAMVFLPGETVVDYAVRLKREFDRTRLWVNGYSNDGRCYIPSERVLQEGGYEGGDAMIYYDFPQKFAPGLEGILVGAVRAQLPRSYRAAQGTEGTRPLLPDEALRSFRTKPNLKVELAAAEPLVQSPVAIDWGADGRLWVCEMSDYPTGIDQNWQPGGRVKVLVDENGDGRYDRGTVFLEKIPFPTGVTAWGRGVLICAAPDILYAEDTDHDGRADRVEKLFSGFFTDNYQARVNSLSLGLDNWIHGANGLLGGEIRAGKTSLWPPQDAGPVNIRNRDFRIDPQSGTFQTVSGLSQQGRVRDDWGNWFGCNNSQLVLSFSGAEEYLARNPSVAAAETARDLTARPEGNRVFPASRLLERFNDPSNANHVTSACGLGIYRDTLLGREFYGNAFTCEPVHNLVHREILTRDLAFTGRRASDEQDSEFLSSRDNWFRPVQARPGPDGALYVVDMYRFLIEHPRWIPAARLAQIDVRAGADRGRIYRIVPTEGRLRPIRDLTHLSGEALASALDNASGVERDRVQIEILTRKDTGTVPRLKELAARTEAPQVRLQALSVLAGLKALPSALVCTALADLEPGVREYALRAAEPLLREDSPASAEVLEAALGRQHDPSPMVVRQLAYTLGESSAVEAGRVLGDLARAWLGNAEIRRAIMSSAMRHGGALLEAILNVDPLAPGRSDWIPPLVAMAANSADSSLITQAIRSVLPRAGSVPNGAQMVAVATLLQEADLRGVKAQSLLDSDTNERIASVRSAAAGIAIGPVESEPDRTAAIRLLGIGPSAAEMKILCKLAVDPAPEVRHPAMGALKPLRSVEVAREILSLWPEASPEARGELVALMLNREEWAVALLQAVHDNSVQARELSRMDRQRLTSSDRAPVREWAQKLLPAEAISGRAEILAKYKAVTTLTGRPERGAEIFTKNCATCHEFRGIGSAVGPDLAALRPRDEEYWVKNILDPNAVIEPRFINYQVDLKDDRTLTGLIQSESATSLTVASGGGVRETILRTSVTRIRALSLSLMPEGLEQGIDPSQMADLLAFLKSGNPRKQIAGNTPETVKASREGILMLAAGQAEIYGERITFEPDFGNIGMWHNKDDQTVWTAEIERAGAYQVFLDYACAAGSAGNPFVLEIDGQFLKGTVGATGGDWSEYRQTKVGTLALARGVHRVILRPEGPLRGALIDLRTIALIPDGQVPKWPAVSTPRADEVLRDPVSLARFILDPAQPEAVRDSAINANPQYAAALIRELKRGVGDPGSAEEYARIPWLWRVALACGKRDDAVQLKAVLEVAVPQNEETLRDWQTVVLGGGIINGLSQRKVWPAERLQEIASEDATLDARWSRALTLASQMADDEKVPRGTRYDALRMSASLGWEKSKTQLQHYLASGADVELQMGAVSGMADIKDPAATKALIHALAYLEGMNRKLAVEGLVRDVERRASLLDALVQGTVARDAVVRAALESGSP